MISKGKIGVILPDLIDSVSFELLSGIAEKADSLGYDVLLFSGIFNSQPDLEYYSYIEGMDNIYELVCKADLDGIIFGADFFNNADLKNRIYGLLEKQKAPCVVMGEEHEGYDSVFMKQRGSVKEITSHLINEHGCRSFYFLAGFAGNRDSEERLAGFRDALDEAGIAFDEKNVFYGNFWVKEPEKLAEKIACGEVEMPDAVVCANDVMAMSLVNALTARGISVPGDIAVTGFDGRWEAYMMSPRITTVIGSFYRFGSDAVRRLMSLIGREDTSSDRSYQRIRFGTSCGCSSFEYGSDYSDDAFLKCHISRQKDRAFKQKQYIATDYISQLSKASTMEELIERMDSLAHILPYWKTIDFCLCGDWFYDFSSPDSFRSQEFSDKTQLILSKRYNTNARCGYDFPTGWVVPELNNEHEPRIWVITSLHSYERILGYTAASYERAEDVCLDDLYVNWMDAVSNGLILLRRRLYREYQQKQLEMQSAHDPATGLYNKNGFLGQLPEFLSKNRDEKTFLMLISSVGGENVRENAGVDVSLIIANALRLSAEKNELYARLGSSVFAVMLAEDSGENFQEVSQKRILALEKKIQFLQGNIAEMQMPDIIFEDCGVSENSDGMEDLIDEQLRKITERAASADGQFADYREQLRRLRRDIYLNPQLDWNIPDIIKKIGISRSHFQRKYKEQFGVNCLDDVINARMEKAQQLLTGTSMRIVEIAAECGYSNEVHFMRQFKSRFGITASQYRKNGTVKE